jgi:hypothetical protein
MIGDGDTTKGKPGTRSNKNTHESMFPAHVSYDPTSIGIRSGRHDASSRTQTVVP